MGHRSWNLRPSVTDSETFRGLRCTGDMAELAPSPERVAFARQVEALSPAQRRTALDRLLALSADRPHSPEALQACWVSQDITRLS